MFRLKKLQNRLGWGEEHSLVLFSNVCLLIAAGQGEVKDSALFHLIL